MDSLNNFLKTEKWWRTEIPTKIVLSDNGVNEILSLAAAHKKNPFFIIDNALAEGRNHEIFSPLLAAKDKYLFAATASEPKTSDVDMLTRLIADSGSEPDVIIGVGGGGTMDLAKAAGICLKNPGPAAQYQGWGFDMVRGVDSWVMPTLFGTGAELTPIAVLRGPEKKLGINTPLVSPQMAVIDPKLPENVKKFNRFYSMMDCYFHHCEITVSKTSAGDAMLDAHDGLALSRKVLSGNLSEYGLAAAIDSAKASILGGSSTVGGRVGAAHAISYGLSNSGPALPHSVAVTISMLALPELYEGGGYDETLKFMKLNDIPVPRASDYGITSDNIPKMTKTALGMDKLWLSHFGEGWEKTVTQDFIEKIYLKITGFRG
ncbi:MAG: iron-containing alcohol dehydrogenase [Synergistaceae bacterium]|nr:iron-containing alcohol dehydrogenase [Synergistaceae bacterium]